MWGRLWREDDIDRLIPYLEGQGVSYLDLFAPFRETDEVLYYHTDSHWNMRGRPWPTIPSSPGWARPTRSPSLTALIILGSPTWGPL